MTEKCLKNSLLRIYRDENFIDDLMKGLSLIATIETEFDRDAICKTVNLKLQKHPKLCRKNLGKTFLHFQGHGKQYFSGKISTTVSTKDFFLVT